MRKEVDLNLLRVFASIARTQSVTAAARELGRPKSSTSRALTALERSLGVQLLHRTTRRVSLTSAGSALLERTGPLLSSLGEALSTLPEQEEEPSGPLRITAAVDL